MPLGTDLLPMISILIRALCAVLLAAAPALPLLENPRAMTPEELHRIAMQVHRYVNEERLSRKIPELGWNEPVALEAGRHAANIASRRFFSHRDPTRGDLDTRLNRSGIEWRRCGENLYEGSLEEPARAAVQAWLHSRGHFQNMMDSMFSEAGVGVAQRSDGTIVVVEAFVLR